MSCVVASCPSFFALPDPACESSFCLFINQTCSAVRQANQQAYPTCETECCTMTNNLRIAFVAVIGGVGIVVAAMVVVFGAQRMKKAADRESVAVSPLGTRASSYRLPPSDRERSGSTTAHGVKARRKSDAPSAGLGASGISFSLERSGTNLAGHHGTVDDIDMEELATEDRGGDDDDDNGQGVWYANDMAAHYTNPHHRVRQNSGSGSTNGAAVAVDVRDDCRFVVDPTLSGPRPLFSATGGDSSAAQPQPSLTRGGSAGGSSPAVAKAPPLPPPSPHANGAGQRRDMSVNRSAIPAGVVRAASSPTAPPPLPPPHTQLLLLGQVATDNTTSSPIGGARFATFTSVGSFSSPLLHQPHQRFGSTAAAIGDVARPPHSRGSLTLSPLPPPSALVDIDVDDFADEGEDVRRHVDGGDRGSQSDSMVVGFDPDALPSSAHRMPSGGVHLPLPRGRGGSGGGNNGGAPSLLPSISIDGAPSSPASPKQGPTNGKSPSAALAKPSPKAAKGPPAVASPPKPAPKAAKGPAERGSGSSSVAVPASTHLSPSSFLTATPVGASNNSSSSSARRAHQADGDDDEDIDYTIVEDDQLSVHFGVEATPRPKYIVSPRVENLPTADIDLDDLSA